MAYSDTKICWRYRCRATDITTTSPVQLRITMPFPVPKDVGVRVIA